MNLALEIRARFVAAERQWRKVQVNAYRDLKLCIGATWNILPFSVRYPASRLPQ